ncbi:substrate-binding domain-containing protein [Amycolatopsis sp. DG1A-15b]|uniref:substrate-binding domain-containing protein n=1 Tax=Amycolatopsis sp. DG1A-15b TaxID=3052846 RepID=UPI00255BA4B8|nr:substrate-binding domain-containing protein [Amycolatopsis sp. DG1A-15b]WIX92419.1 substrate-binding domain-containing protein [Amycolatopsis sp. DG1A-15b]
MSDFWNLTGAHDEEAGMAAARQLLGLEFPRDISIVGFDDNHLSHLSHIDLTTVHQDAAGLAQAAVHAVTDRLENESRAPAEIVLDPKLVVRGTTGPPTR